MVKMGDGLFKIGRLCLVALLGLVGCNSDKNVSVAETGGSATDLELNTNATTDADSHSDTTDVQTTAPATASWSSSCVGGQTQTGGGSLDGNFEGTCALIDQTQGRYAHSWISLLVQAQSVGGTGVNLCVSTLLPDVRINSTDVQEYYVEGVADYQEPTLQLALETDDRQETMAAGSNPPLFAVSGDLVLEDDSLKGPLILAHVVGNLNKGGYSRLQSSYQCTLARVL